jgi:hypothetical protein
MSFTLGSGLLTTTQASKLVNREESSVRWAIAHGTLPATANKRGHWRLAPEDVIAWDRRTSRIHRGRRTRAWEQAAALLADYGSLSAEELAELAGIHVGNARKHLAILAKQGRSRRLADGQWVLTDRAGEGQGAA